MIAKTGDRIELDSMPNDPHPVPSGSRGTVLRVTRWSGLEGADEYQLSMDWDNGRSLCVIVPPDTFHVINGEED